MTTLLMSAAVQPPLFLLSTLRDAAMPTKKLNIAQAKAQFSKLITDAAHGKTTIVARGGRPVARIAPLDEKPRKIRFGTYKGRLVIPADRVYNRVYPGPSPWGPGC
jgi:antitoxin (DNA-binding transcriptional repressor) of toxin-antitoxin stability system